MKNLKRTVIVAFKIMGSLLLGLMLWTFLLGGRLNYDTGRIEIENNVVQRQLWERGRDYNEGKWVLATGKDGEVNTSLENATWGKVTNSEGSYKAN